MEVDVGLFVSRDMVTLRHAVHVLFFFIFFFKPLNFIYSSTRDGLARRKSAAKQYRRVKLKR